MNHYYIVNPNPSGTAGLEVSFNDDGIMMVMRPVADRSKGFSLSREAALEVAELIIAEMTDDEFYLAT